MGEIWKTCVYNGIVYANYGVSNYGRVKALPRLKRHRNGKYFYTKEKILKQEITKRGYYRVGLRGDANTKQVHCLVHRLVAFAFVDGYFADAVADHIDTNPLNNRADNLKWCTCLENSNNPLTIEAMSIAQIKSIQERKLVGTYHKFKEV